MGTLSQIRTGLKLNLESAMSGYTVLDYEHKAPPAWAIIVGWPDVYDPRATYGGDIDLVIPVRVEIPWQDDDSSDDALDQAMAAIVAAIETDRTLSGVCSDLSCAPYTDIGARTMPNDAVNITFTVPVEILV
jgi:hypothetical protein